MELDGKVAFITGAGGGIGRGCALDMAMHGARVVAVGIHQDRVDRTRAAVESAGGTCLSIEADISDRSDVDRAVDQSLEQFGRIDVMVNSAAFRVRGTFMEMTEEDWKRVIDVNLTGTWHVAQAVAKPMIEQRKGTMILFASDRGLYGSATACNYAASKGGVIAFGKSIALELGKHQVTVNIINPGTIPTDRPGASAEEQARQVDHRQQRANDDPLGRLNSVEHIAQYVRWLASTGGEFLTGQLITVRTKP